MGPSAIRYAGLAERIETTGIACSDSGDLPVPRAEERPGTTGRIEGRAKFLDEVGVVWFDAHGDFNTPETTPSGNVHGMSLSAALGHGAFGGMDWANAPGLSEDNVALVGLRDLDPGERERVRKAHSV